MPKYQTTVLSCLVMISFLFGQQRNKQQIVIESINFYTKTIADVSCDQFESQLGPMITKNVVVAEDSIMKVKSWLSNLKYSKDNGSLDARAKFVYTNEKGKKISICMNLFGIWVQGREVEKDTVFFEFLRSLIPKKQLAYSPAGS